MVGTPHTRFDSFYVTWPPLHIPIPPRAPKYRFSRESDQDEGFFFTFCHFRRDILIFFKTLRFRRDILKFSGGPITDGTEFSKMIVLSSWRYETILRIICFGGVDMMDPPSKVRFCSSYSKIHKITFLSLSKNHQISCKISQNGSPEAIFFLGILTWRFQFWYSRTA